MTNLYYFYEAVDDNVKEADIFYVQCEWFNKIIDLDAEMTENEEYCQITITDLNDYWQITITREMLIEKFKPSNCLIHKSRNKVLSLSLRGSKWIKKHQIQWAYVKCENGQIEMKLRVHYFDIIYGVAGSFFMDKLPDDKKKEVNKTWYKNCAAASLKSNETEEALTIRHDDMKNICDELKATLNTLKTESIEYRFTIFSNFSKVLNTKKEKIAELNSQVDYLQKRNRDVEDDEEQAQDERPVKIQKIAAPPPRSKTQRAEASSSQPRRVTRRAETSSSQSQIPEASSSQVSIKKEASSPQVPIQKETSLSQVSMKKEPASSQEPTNKAETPQKTVDKGKAPQESIDKEEASAKRKYVPIRTITFDTSEEESEDELKDLFDKKTKKFGL